MIMKIIWVCDAHLQSTVHAVRFALGSVLVTENMKVKNSLLNSAFTS